MSNGLSWEIPRPEPRNRAKELVDYVATRYRLTQDALKPEQSINLVCSVGGLTFDLYNIAAPSMDAIQASGKIGDTVHIAIAPVEQMSFVITVENTQAPAPPRTVGFGEVESAAPPFFAKSGSPIAKQGA